MWNQATRFLAVLLFASACCFAQSTGSIAGVVVDASGAVVPDARVELTHADTGQSRPASSAADGHFAFPDLAPGRYQVRFTVQGFSELLLRDLVLTVGQQMTVHPILKVSAVSEAVEVVGTPPPVSTETSSVSHLVDSQRIDRLPLNGRNALQLVALVPGVIETAAIGQFGATQVSFSVGGGRSVEMNFSLDGGANLNTFYNSANEYPNPDALQEFAVTSRSYSAVSGRGLSQVAAVTKSGTNQLHGSLFEFLRNTELDARPFFAARRSAFKRNQYGGTVGGPIRRNRAFFFFGYQGTKQRGSPGDTRYRTLTEAERQGDFSATRAAVRDPSNNNAPFPGNRIPAGRILPFATRFIDTYLPPANSGDFFAFTPGNKLDQHQVTGKVDYAFTDNDRVSFRYLFNEIPQRSGGTIDPSWDSDFPTRNQNWNLTYNRIFRPDLLMSLRATHVRNTFGVRTRKEFTLGGLGLDVNTSNAISEFGLTPGTQMIASGFFTASTNIPTRDIVPTTHFTGIMTWMPGKHKIEFGAEVYRNRVNQLQNWLVGGDLRFNGFASGNAAADFLLGWFNNYRQKTPLITRMCQTLPSLFFQDDIRLRRNLTLNLGLRWDPFIAWTSADDVLATFRPGAQSRKFPNMLPGPLYPGDDGLPRSIVGNRYGNVAPRVGFAWDVRGNGRTSVRAGAGLFYMPLTRGIQFNRFAQNQPFAVDLQLIGGNTASLWAQAPFLGRNPFPRPEVSNIEELRRAEFVPTAGFTSFALPFKTQMSSQWSLSVQQAVRKNAVVELAYVGSSASHLYTAGERNYAVYIPGQSTVANTQARRLMPLFGAIQDQRASLSSNYNSFQASFTQRLAGGLSVLSSYTLAKTLGVVGGFTEGSANQRSPYDHDLDYARAEFDARHNWVTSFIWDIPFGRKASHRFVRALAGGWQVNGINTLRSGLPFTVRSGADNSRTGIGGDTADQVGDWRLADGRSRGERIQRYFNTAAFVQNALGTFGTTGINALEGPGFWNLDAGILRNFQVRESQRIEFRAQFYNLANNANLGQPNANVPNPTFGRITSTVGSPRVIEFGLKFAF